MAGMQDRQISIFGATTPQKLGFGFRLADLYLELAKNPGLLR
jgi:hypothetical protein